MLLTKVELKCKIKINPTVHQMTLPANISPTLIINGIESLILVLLTLRFFVSGNPFKKIKRIRKEEILVFAFIFSLFIAFMAGFTSVLFGVLVRIRAPLLPFFFLVLTSSIDKKEAVTEIEK